METRDRPAQWVLELGMRVCGGARPWLPPLTGGSLGLCSWLLLSWLTSTGLWADPATTGRGDDLVTVVFTVATSGMVTVGIVYLLVGMRAHRTWHTALTEDERRDMLTEYSRRLYSFLEALDPRTSKLDFTRDDLEDLSISHRQQLGSLIAAAAEVDEPGFCSTVRHESWLLLEAARLHRKLSLESIVRAETAVPLVLAELDEEITKTADYLLGAVESGECACGREHTQLNRLIDVCGRAQQQANTGRGN